MSFGKEVRRLREAAGLTQAELAAKARFSQSYLAMIESGKRTEVAADIVFRLADTLGVSTEHFRSFFLNTAPVAAAGVGAGVGDGPGEPALPRVISKRK